MDNALRRVVTRSALHSLATASGAVSLAVTLAACGGGDTKSTPPIYTGRPSPSTTTTSRPSTTAPTATGTSPTVLAAKSTHTYGGLSVVVNLPTEIPSASRPSLRFFSDFLQGVGRSKAQGKLEPSLSSQASAKVLTYLRTTVGGDSVQQIGALSYTISKVRTTSGPALITGCLDQSKLVQVRKDGSQFVDAATKRNPTLKLTANINPGNTGPQVTLYTFALGPC
jgi:hypothetical protein